MLPLGSSLRFQTPDELQKILGEQIKRLRLWQNGTQRAVAERAGISVRALRNLEEGRGSSVESLVRVLKSLDSLRGLETLAPDPEIDPVAIAAMQRKLYKRQRSRQRPGQERWEDMHPDIEKVCYSRSARNC